MRPPPVRLPVGPWISTRGTRTDPKTCGCESVRDPGPRISYGVFTPPARGAAAARVTWWLGSEAATVRCTRSLTWSSSLALSLCVSQKQASNRGYDEAAAPQPSAGAHRRVTGGRRCSRLHCGRLPGGVSRPVCARCPARARARVCVRACVCVACVPPFPVVVPFL